MSNEIPRPARKCLKTSIRASGTPLAQGSGRSGNTIGTGGRETRLNPEEEDPMRKFFWLVPVAMLAFGGSAMAQDAAKAKPAKAKPAKLVADPDKVEIGDVKAGETKDVTFKIKNDGEAEAKNVSCKAAGFKFDKEKVTIAGGAAEEFKGTYTAAAKAGKKDKALKLTITCGKAKVAATGTLKAAEAAAPAEKPAK
jgi:hypothetical protein